MWRPSPNGGVRLGQPSGDAPPEPGTRVRLQAPDFSTPEPRKAAVDERAATPALPVGIAQFTQVKDQIASGLRPYADGVQWLKDNGYRTVLHVRQPGEDDGADRRSFTERGLKYVSLEVSPNTLTEKTVSEFNRLVGDAVNRPLFVYDNDGKMAGALWYLHFRLVDKLSEAEARTKSAGLGLKEDQAGEQQMIWLAIQKYLSEQKK
jgi:protein tyrosine phosphatase (PTP) superfamily phosphohydrolase (DUF442 family)